MSLLQAQGRAYLLVGCEDLVPNECNEWFKQVVTAELSALL